MEDRQLERKGGDWLEYKREVPSPLVPLPPFLNRRLAGASVTASVSKEHKAEGVQLAS